MEYARFMLCGQDKKLLAGIKNVLTANGHIFTGYSINPFSVLRQVRGSQPELVIFDITGGFREFKPVIEVIDDDLLAACIILLDSRSDEVFEFLRASRTATYIAKPVFGEVMLQIAELAVTNYLRVLDYEGKLKELNNALESRKVIEKAKWLLVEQEGITEKEAYDVLRKKSRDNRMAMRDIAEAILIARGTM